MKRAEFARALAFSAAAAALPICAMADKPATLSVVGQVLALDGGYLVFTTGDAVRLEPKLKFPQHLPLGITVRATLDPLSHTIVDLEIEPKHLRDDDLSASRLPREYVVASPASLRTPPPAGSGQGGASAKSVTVTIDLRVPESTPINDDVYIATDRTSFSPAEIRMLRVDARTWSVSIDVAPGSQLRYEFTRGTFSSIERDRRGGLIVPRSVNPSADLTVHDSVAAWADVN